MAHIAINLGNETVTEEFTKSDGTPLTNAEARQALILFIQGWADPVPEGLTSAQQQTWLLQQSVKRDKVLMRQVIANAKRENRRQQRELEDQQDEQSII